MRSNLGNDIIQICALLNIINDDDPLSFHAKVGDVEIMSNVHISFICTLNPDRISFIAGVQSGALRWGAMCLGLLQGVAPSSVTVL